MGHYQFIFETVSTQEQEVLIALLDNIEFEGFEEGEKHLTAFVAVDKFDQPSFDTVINSVATRYSKSLIEERNWNQQWESGFQPVIIPHPATGIPFVQIRAEFHKPIERITHDLLITPKMSFGTGHHATTFLMIQQMILLDFSEKKVIDFGTGTGILSILAEKLGAAKIIAIDNDEWSINNARENIMANECKYIALRKEEKINDRIAADIILANINLNVIIANLKAIKMACKPRATLLFSGILETDKDEICQAIELTNFSVKECVTKDNWLVILVKGE